MTDSASALLDEYRLENRPRRGDTFLVEGRWAVESLLASEFHVRSVLLAEGQHLDFTTERAPILRRAKAELESLLGFDFHRGVLAIGERPTPRALGDAALAGCVVVCPNIADESNLGSIVRNAAAFGAKAVAVPADRGADIFSRKAIRASSGTVFRVPIVESPSLLDDVRGLQERGYTVVGSVLSDETMSLRDVSVGSDFVLLLGGEGDGLDADWQSVCDVRVTIPMATGVDSLNVASSSAVLLYALTQAEPRGPRPE